ncbi:MAG: ester cyclase [Proteobacteria bacterium]|nr:ester cyclase [Pseudomonadota bacterium]
MTTPELSLRYRRYIDVLNRQDWDSLGEYVADDVVHNGRALGVAGYRAMLAQDYRDIPDLHFAIERMVCEPPHVAARLRFHCTPVGRFLGLDVNGRTVDFTENVFYAWRDGRIAEVWSVIDKAAIEAQLR